MSLERKVYKQCVLLVVTYRFKAITLTKINLNNLRISQRKMERSILGIKLTDNIKITEILRGTGMEDVIEKITKLRWTFSGHVA